MYCGMMATQMSWGIVEKEGWRKGPWTSEEDRLLIEYVRLHGEGRWNSVVKLSGLKRNGKSCRLRWVNYLRPDLKRGQITPHEESIILQLHARWGNRWSTIARSLPGRTDNEIKNYWRTHFKKKVKVPSDASEKAKNRLLCRQQFHQQQQQQQQQQQLQQFNQADMKTIMGLLDENDTKMTVWPPHQAGQAEQDMDTSTATAYPIQISTEEPGFFYSMLNGNVPYAAEASSSEDSFLWDGLWNMDDVHGNFTTSTCASGKSSTFHNFVVPFS